MEYSNDYMLVRDGELRFGICSEKKRRETMNEMAEIISWNNRKMAAEFSVKAKLCGKNEEGKKVVISGIVSVEKIDTRPISHEKRMELYEMHGGTLDVMYKMTCGGFLFRQGDGTGYIVPLVPVNSGDWSEKMKRQVAKIKVH